MNRLELARQQIVAARDYTLRLLQDLPDEQWPQMPAGGITHVTWQVGHLTIAQYRLVIDRLGGPLPTVAERPLDLDLYARLFGVDSQPQPEANLYPLPPVLRAGFDQVHQAALLQLDRTADSELDLPPTRPHPLFNTRLGSLFWCARHEMLHAGQIGLLRRLLGHKPLW